MFIIWGARTTRTPAGHAAHFCPVCRRLEFFRVATLGQGSHVYWVPLGGSRPVADELTCRGCRAVLGFQPGVIHPVPYADAADILAMASRTGPMTEDAIDRRLCLEERMSAGRLSPDERSQLNAEPILALDYMHSLHVARGVQTSVSAMLQLLLLAGFCASAILWYLYFDTLPRSPDLLVWSVGATAASLFLTLVLVYRGITDGRRAARRYVLRHLGRALAPMSPSPTELDDVLTRLRDAESLSLAHAVSPSELNAAIEAARREQSQVKAPSRTAVATS